MGKIFLVLVFAGIIYTGWNLFSGADEPLEEKQGSVDEFTSRFSETTDSEKLDEPAKDVPNIAQDETLPGKLFVLAACADWLLVKEWGFCQEGDELPCGRVLKSWSDRLAVVMQDGKERVLRFARVAEFPEWNEVPEPMTGEAPRPPEQSKEGSPGGIVASLFGGQ